MVTPWNKLPEEVVMATSTNNFKNLLDRHRATMMESIQVPIVLLCLEVGTEWTLSKPSPHLYTYTYTYT